ncbi:SRP54-domain-containing protein [Tothia fuscella]|uniref:Signal recognition particle receptor subunit alpha homolog n=1 Tax=Tothia fuscella TaxID=1048955 RepID=A0A9P4P015_9PEZI|nr:SRP54-domain-containing protein [Tothia fuscella]
MLDTFEIITTSGVVLWSKTYVPVASSLINNLIREVFVEERGANARAENSGGQKPTYRRDGYTLKWTAAKDLGLIFVAVYQSLLQIRWIDKLLENVRALFTELYRDQITKPNCSAVDCPFDQYFDRQIQELEKLDKDAGPQRGGPTIDVTPPTSDSNDNSADDMPPPPKPVLRTLNSNTSHDTTSTDVTPIPTPDASRPGTPRANHLLTGRPGLGGRGSRRSRKGMVAGNSAPVSSGDETPANASKKGTKGAKKMRKWDANGHADEDDGTTLDYSAPVASSNLSNANVEDSAEQEKWGTRTAKGEYMLKDIGDEMNAILSSANSNAGATNGDAASGLVGSSIGAISGLFRNVVGGKTLTKEDLVKPLKGMEDHLLKKNVAREAAVRLCNSVERDLIGMKTGNFTSIDTTLRTAMEKALRKILTPTSPLDLLREIQSTVRSSTKRRPYVISIVGVNGVGKSTNLSKIAFFLLQNHYRVLIAAGDTFRSGAVEQLRVHVNNLKELTQRQGKGAVDLFEKGYGKDAAHIARDSVEYAAAHAYDVVLIDTAGRRHNDARLMSSLEKFAELAKPDKILMVGEALVGSDAVQQARHFDAAFGVGRRLDGFIVSKCDTVGDMVGTLVSMVHATGIPVLFLGTGQHYGDLRVLRVESVVGLLMQ